MLHWILEGMLNERVLHINVRIHSTRSGGMTLGLKSLGYRLKEWV